MKRNATELTSPRVIDLDLTGRTPELALIPANSGVPLAQMIDFVKAWRAGDYETVALAPSDGREAPQIDAVRKPRKFLALERQSLAEAGNLLEMLAPALRDSGPDGDQLADVAHTAGGMVRVSIARLKFLEQAIADAFKERGFPDQHGAAVQIASNEAITIRPAGHDDPLLTIDTGVWKCEVVSDGISLSHHGEHEPAVSGWVMAFDDLARIYESAKAGRRKKRPPPESSPSDSRIAADRSRRLQGILDHAPPRR